MDKNQLINILNDSPSIRLVRSRSLESILTFLTGVFTEQTSVSQEQLYVALEQFLDNYDVNLGEEDELTDLSRTNEDKAKRWIKEWADKGFLTNYQNENGDIIYELSSYSSKVIDWVKSLKKEDYIGTESKFKALFNQLKDLVEFTNEDKEKRIAILEKRKLEIEHQIQNLRMGEEVEVFENYQIESRYREANKMAKELLSDFKEVDDNFKEIIRQIYQRQTNNSVKRDILNYVFDAYSELKNSSQGKSFYSFWEFLLSNDLQEEWDNLIQSLYNTLQNRQIVSQDKFLKDVKQHLLAAGDKVNRTNDKMSEKLSRLIRQNELSNTAITKTVINDIKKLLIKTKLRENPDVSIEIEDGIKLKLPMERQLTLEPSKETEYIDKPTEAQLSIEDLSRLEKLYNPHLIDRAVLRRCIDKTLSERSQATLAEVVESNDGISKGLAEVFGYISILKDYKTNVDKDKSQFITFDNDNGKTIEIPEIIITR